MIEGSWKSSEELTSAVFKGAISRIDQFFSAKLSDGAVARGGDMFTRADVLEVSRAIDHLAATTYKKYVLSLARASAKQVKALKIMKSNGIVFDDLENQWQKLAFTLYSMLVEIHDDAISATEPEE